MTRPLSVMARVRTLTRRAKNQTLSDLLHWLNPVLRGWATYFKHGVSKQTFSRRRTGEPGVGQYHRC
jgi:hypothetical protein